MAFYPLPSSLLPPYYLLLTARYLILTLVNIQTWLRKASEKLANVNIATNTLDAQVLLADLLKVDKSWLHAHPEFELSKQQQTKLDAQVTRRINHEPLAYIRGRQEFYGREFCVSPDTLTPRPETETMIEVFKEQMKYGVRGKEYEDELQATLSSEKGAMSNEEAPKNIISTPVLRQSTSYSLPPTTPIQIIDVGTGSGCIIITAALELNTQYSTLSAQFTGLDISLKALQIAQINATKHKANVDFKEFDLRIDPLYSLLTPHSSLIILANLPYVPNDFHINLAASHEPPFAIFGGADGLDYYRLLFEQLSRESGAMSQEKLQTPRSKPLPNSVPNAITIITESLPPQHTELEMIAQASGFKLQETRDFIQVFSRRTQATGLA